MTRRNRLPQLPRLRSSPQSGVFLENEMPKPFFFDHPYSLTHSDDGIFTLTAHGIPVASYDVKTWKTAQACVEAAWAFAYTSPSERITLEGVRGAVARGWCEAENAHKEMDVDLIEAITREVYALLTEATG